MSTRTQILALVALLMVGCGGDGEPATTAGSEGFRLPRGNVEAGRQAFVDLGCNACHATPADTMVPEPQVEDAPHGPAIGPELTGQSAARIADSIIDPSHEIPPPRDSLESPMGDYSEAMTVRQLIDLVAYVHAQAEARP